MKNPCKERPVPKDKSLASSFRASTAPYFVLPPKPKANQGVEDILLVIPAEDSSQEESLIVLDASRAAALVHRDEAGW